jgi:hypothetical protein
VLPEPQHTPAFRNQNRLVLCVPLTIGEQLPTPELSVRLRQVGVLLAVVSEASVDEDGDTCSREHEVRPHPAPGADLTVHEEPPSPPVQLSAQRQLGRRVAPTDASHVPSPSVVRFPNLHAPILVGRSSLRGSRG